MRVRNGWSGEIESVWQKVDVEVDENDLVRILLENDLPAEISSRLPTKLIFQLMQNEAETLLLTRLVGLGYPTGKASARIHILSQQNTNIADTIKQKLAPA